MKQQYNCELFEKILNYINENPQSFNVTTWKEESECGTTMCIAGLACYLSDILVPDFRTFSTDAMSDWYFNNARKLLNININEANLLFHLDDEEEAVSMLEEILLDKDKEDQRTITHIYIYILS